MKITAKEFIQYKRYHFGTATTKPVTYQLIRDRIMEILGKPFPSLTEDWVTLEQLNRGYN